MMVFLDSRAFINDSNGIGPVFTDSDLYSSIGVLDDEPAAVADTDARLKLLLRICTQLTLWESMSLCVRVFVCMIVYARFNLYLVYTY